MTLSINFILNGTVQALKEFDENGTKCNLPLKRGLSETEDMPVIKKPLTNLDYRSEQVAVAIISTQPAIDRSTKPLKVVESPIKSSSEDYFQFLKTVPPLIALDDNIFLPHQSKYEVDNTFFEKIALHEEKSSEQPKVLTPSSPFLDLQENQIADALERFFAVLITCPLDVFKLQTISPIYNSAFKLRFFLRATQLYRKHKGFPDAVQQAIRENSAISEMYKHSTLERHTSVFQTILRYPKVTLMLLKNFHLFRDNEDVEKFATSNNIKGIYKLYIDLLRLTFMVYGQLGDEMVKEYREIAEGIKPKIGVEFEDVIEEEKNYLIFLNNIAEKYFKRSNQSRVLQSICRKELNRKGNRIDVGLSTVHSQASYLIYLFQNIKKTRALFAKLEPRTEYHFRFSKCNLLSSEQITQLCHSVKLKVKDNDLKFCTVINLLNCEYGHELINNWKLN